MSVEAMTNAVAKVAQEEYKRGVNDGRKQWVGLTDEEVYDLADEHLYNGGKNYGILSFYKTIEAKLKEKNGG